MDAIAKTTKSAAPLLLAIVLIGIVIAVVILAVDFVMLLFLASLFGVFLTKTSNLLKDRVPIGYAGSLASISIALVLVSIGTMFMFGVQIENKMDEASEQLDSSVNKLERWLGHHPTAHAMFRKVPFASEALFGEDGAQGNGDASQRGQGNERSSRGNGSGNDSSGSDQRSGADGSADKSSSPSDTQTEEGAGRSPFSYSDNESMAGGSSGSGDQQSGQDAGMTSSVVKTGAGKVFDVLKKMVNTTLGMIANLGVIFFVGLFLAVHPHLYRDGFAKLFPIDRRERVKGILDEMATAMFNWLNGRFLAMLITGAGTSVALMLLGVPMAFMVGVITGVLTFIPNIGAVISLSIAMLMGLSQGAMTAIWVLVLYAVLQLVESNVITPLVQQKQTSIPPALLISFQLIMGALTGFLGVLIATPLLAAMMVLVKELWIKDTLGDESPETVGASA